MHNVSQLESQRLVLVASTAAHVRTELETPDQLGTMLGASVSSAWPSGEYDSDAMQFFLARLEEGGAAAQGWYGWYALTNVAPDAGRTLIGGGGYFGPPGADGTVEIGYSVLPEWQRQGVASEIVAMLVAHAMTFAQVARVIAHTAHDNLGSTKALLNNGFIAAGNGEAPGTLRFERQRP